MKIEVSIATQTLCVLTDDGDQLRRYRVSTAANGPGETNGSFCTPRGRHMIRAKIGAGQPVNTVFVGRRASGEIFSPQLEKQFPQRDWILTRIMWLSGRHPGFNRLGNVDSMRRFIYIHGAPESVQLGQPGSHGCIRMSNADVIELFDLVPLRTEVLIMDNLADRQTSR